MSKTFTLYSANCTGMESNCNYPNPVEVNGIDTLRTAVSRDYVVAKFKNSYRNTANFMSANCLCKDCDNDHSDNPQDWVTPEDVRQAFPDVPLAVHYSRNHMKPKRGKAPRPKFHCVLLIDEVTDHEEYKRLAKLAHEVFPYFDTRAEDAAHFFFGTQNPQVEYWPGTITLNECIDMYHPDADEDAFWNLEETHDSTIPEGSRNATMSRFAGCVLKRFGDTEEAHQAFLQRAEKCVPPLEDAELATIWRSAQSFYQRISQDENYVPPEKWNTEDAPRFTYEPDDRSDVGQARMLAKYFGQELRYSPATDYIRYDGACWQETKPGAQAVVHALTDLQLEEAENAVAEATKQLKETGAQALIQGMGRKKAETLMNDAQREAFYALLRAENYRAYVLRHRESRYISSTLKEARPVLEITPSMLDKDAFLLCTPDATYDLHKGIAGARPHDPNDFITKMTSYSPSNKGAQIWLDALNTFFCGDQVLIKYVQRVAGIVCIGQVFEEGMIIAYGDGRNGKSTFWNTLARVMGSYSGNISADTLTMSCKRNVKPEMAETKGKRLLIASELQEGNRLNDSMVKQLTSTDPVYAEKKYKDPFSFIPSHTLVLYTNHLPKVGAKDDGIWRRLIVIPFNAKIQGNSDIKNYTEYLCENAGGAIMKWMIEGAEEVIQMEYKVPLPKCVEDAIAAYKAQNDWLGHFLDECCEIGEGLTAKSGELYAAYRTYSATNGEYIRSTTDFYAALENGGYTRTKVRSGMLVNGLKLALQKNDPVDEFPDFLN